MTAMPRSGLSLLAALLTGAAIAGCGGGGSLGDLDGFEEADRSAPVPAGWGWLITEADAERLARSINLRLADVPYFEQMPDDDEGRDVEDRRLERRFRRCVHLAGPEVETVVERSSSIFGASGGGGFLTVQSQVEVMPTAYVAREQARLLRRPRALACLDRIYSPAFERDSSRADVGSVGISRLPVPEPGPADAVGLRISARISVSPEPSRLVSLSSTTASTVRTVPVDIDILTFVVGHADVSLIATGAPDPVSRHLEGNLLRLLHDRALEASG